jgi:transcriptional regulator with XRE-family HTH domain
MPYIKPHKFDEKVIERINEYISMNDLSHKKIAEEAGMTYQQFYQLRHKNQTIKLREYIKLCDAFNEPYEYFVQGLDADK